MFFSVCFFLFLFLFVCLFVFVCLLFVCLVFFAVVVVVVCMFVLCCFFFFFFCCCCFFMFFFFNLNKGIFSYNSLSFPLQDEYRRFRETFCVKTDIFLVCFSVTEPETLENVRQNWLTEIRILTPKSPFILVGMKTDLRDDSETLAKLKEKDQEPVSMLQGIKMAKSLGAKEYVECSSINLIGVKRVFETAVIVLEQGKQKPKTAKRRSHNTCNIS